MWSYIYGRLQLNALTPDLQQSLGRQQQMEPTNLTVNT